MRDTDASIRACLARNAAWRREAGNLRALVAQPHLADQQRASLLRQAAAADRQADWWLNSAIETRGPEPSTSARQPTGGRTCHLPSIS